MVQHNNIDMGDLSLREKITSLNNIIKTFRMSLEGYIWSGEDEKYYDTGRPLADSRIIDELVALLTPFTNNVNLITIKDVQTFYYQQLFFCREVNKILHTSPYSIKSHYTQVFLIIDDTFQNIGDIILGSKSLIRDMSVNPTEDTSMGGSI